ncbi:subclass B1 metallo-beta-lactamase [Arundinibacter roseus]|uniref:Beta-lactamase n=1 Tax=Arundinibacter roseus TaxID=2070510 RepID=A0A4R4KHH2_9BACT|nr:subclass B1 metallo-beta-lactamase [Arundinibacter roseus]TDB67554.1 subclass B1 metallo-beta-lactamase [Arundinibacter roseus]
MKILFVPVLFIFLLFGCQSVKVTDQSFSSERLIVQKLKDHVYLHTSYLQTQTFGKVSCNGMIVYDKNQAVIYDTPGDDSTSAQLIAWVKDQLHCKVVAIIPTHFHTDCLGGLAEFHRQGIPSYASLRTINLAEKMKYVVPQKSFDTSLELTVGNQKVLVDFPGEGHTRDNVIGYFPSEKVMFGGCLIKEVNAGKGNLEDANLAAWSQTVTNLKNKYADAEVVIPGHGKVGNTALLDYTVSLFAQPK